MRNFGGNETNLCDFVPDNKLFWIHHISRFNDLKNIKNKADIFIKIKIEQHYPSNISISISENYNQI